jgi:hypothetical protein
MIELSFHSDIDVHNVILAANTGPTGGKLKSWRTFVDKIRVNAPTGFSETDYATEAII